MSPCCGLVAGYQHFGGIYSLRFLGLKSFTEGIQPSKWSQYIPQMLVPTYYRENPKVTWSFRKLLGRCLFPLCGGRPVFM
jgi:hypothetical protein